MFGAGVNQGGVSWITTAPPGRSVVARGAEASSPWIAKRVHVQLGSSCPSAGSSLSSQHGSTARSASTAQQRQASSCASSTTPPSVQMHRTKERAGLMPQRLWSRANETRSSVRAERTMKSRGYRLPSDPTRSRGAPARDRGGRTAALAHSGRMLGKGPRVNNSVSQRGSWPGSRRKRESNGGGLDRLTHAWALSAPGRLGGSVSRPSVSRGALSSAARATSGGRLCNAASATRMAGVSSRPRRAARE